MAIFEPRISGSKALRVIRKLGFTNSYVVDAEGFSGGIWLLWNNSKVKLHVVAHSRHTITTLVEDYNTFWILTVVYANHVSPLGGVFGNTLILLGNALDYHG